MKTFSFSSRHNFSSRSFVSSHAHLDTLAFLLLTQAIGFGQTPENQQTQEENPLTLDQVVISASPLTRTLFEQAQAVSILSGERLQQQTQATLGETLSTTPGVRSSYFGPAASRPVIRGLDADRIRILQNGVNTIDASGTSADHAVSFDPISAESIEIVRGPATLLYGANAIGGVVNVIDNRIPDQSIDVPATGILDGRYSSVDAGESTHLLVEGGKSGFNYHIEANRRNQHDTRIPGFARSDQLRALAPLAAGETEEQDTLANSFLDADGFSMGASRTWDHGFFGIAYSGYDSNYGTVAEKEVALDMTNRRWDFRGSLDAPVEGIKALNFRFGLGNYEHTEFEGAEIGTIFRNDGYDSRIEILHEKIGRLEGAIGYQGERSDFSALGDEAFLPPVLTTSNSVFVFEEYTLAPQWKLQGGVRYDHITTSSSTNSNFGPGQSRSFDNVSTSTGLIFTPSDDYAYTASISHSKRAPTYQELYANGPHVATQAFEIGDANMPVEQAIGLDLSLRKRTGFVTGSITGFVNHFDDYTGLFPTGATKLINGEQLPVYAYRSTEARFYGAEAEATFHLIKPVTTPESVIAAEKNGSQPSQPRVEQSPHGALDLELKADHVIASDQRSGDPLPRISPFHASAALEYQLDDFSARLEGVFAAKQTRVADQELPTDAYTMINASISKTISAGGFATKFYIKGVNLTNVEAREHTSFLKDIAPLAGRGVVVGAAVEF